MNFASSLGSLVTTRRRRETLIALSAAYLLVQLSSLPVALSLPSLAEYFDTGIDEAAWIVIIYLLMLGSWVLIAARLGDRYGHRKVFFVGILIATIGAGVTALSQELWHVVAWRGVSGIGSALVMGNANAILAETFQPEERGRAFAIPIVGARFGTLIGLLAFGLFLSFLSWRLIFVSFLPIGLLAIIAAIPMLRHQEEAPPADASGPIDWTGGLLLAATASVLILSGSHLHAGEESFVSAEGFRYHLPMNFLFLVLAAVFVLVERRIHHPMIDLRHFGVSSFSLALSSNVAFHFSMLATMTLVPILVEDGFGMSPIFVTVVLLPGQVLGLFAPLIAGWIFDRYRPKLLRPLMLVLIAGGFLLLGLAAPHVSFWVLPLLMLPIATGSNMFNPINNATVMNSLPLEHRGVASGMLETTRELGHAVGATVAATVLALSLPAGIETLTRSVAGLYFVQGFRLASLMVVLTLVLGAALAYVQTMSRRPPSTQPSYQAGNDD